MEQVSAGQASIFSIQLEDYKKLNTLIREEVERQTKAHKEEPYSSTETATLNAALAKAQGDFKPVIFNRMDPYLELQYVDLCNLISASRPSLTSNGIAITQFIETPIDGSTILHTRLLHDSGQWMETRARILPIKNDVSAYESALNVQKRLSYMALLGIVPQDDTGDDNGEVAMIHSNEYIANGPSQKLNPKHQSMAVIAKHELEALEEELKGFPDLAENLLERLMIQSLADLPSSQYRATLTRVRKIKDELASRGVKPNNKY
jgi:hypothetical protein